MKILGICLMVAGVIWAIVAFNMNTAVTTDSHTFGSGEYAVTTPPVTVNNLGLMATRRNNLMFAGFTILVGAVFVGFGSLRKPSTSSDPNLTACPNCAEPIRAGATVCKHCGNKVPNLYQQMRQGSGPYAARAAARRERSDALRICAQLKEGRELSSAQYYKLARVGGVLLSMPTSASPSPRYTVIYKHRELHFKSPSELRDWFLGAVVPNIEGAA